MAYFPQQATVYIGAADAASSTATDISAGITNFNQSGGEIDTETIKVFGGGNIHKEGEKGEIEVSFDIVMRETNALIFDQLVAGSSLDGSTAVSYADDPTNKVIYVEFAGDDGSTYMTRAYNNVIPSTLEASMEADNGYLQGSITFKVAPTEPDSTSNVKIEKGQASGISWS